VLLLSAVASGRGVPAELGLQGRRR